MRKRDLNTVKNYRRRHKPEHPRSDSKGSVYEHILIAERVLRRPLKKPELVHHVDGNGTNNVHTNLVICPDQSYHSFLHRRTESLGATGSPHNLYCNDCMCWLEEINFYPSALRQGLRLCKQCQKIRTQKWRMKKKN